MGTIFASMLVLLSLLAACGGAATPATPAAPAAQEPTTAPEAAAVEPAATVAIEGPTAVTVKPTGVPEVNCTADQRVLVWMVRNGPVENPWEANVVRPAYSKAHPEICLKILSINQDDIAVKREAMIAAGEQLDVWSTNWGGDGFASDRARGLITDLTPLIQRDNFDTSVFVPSVLKIYESEGKTWGLPFLTTGSYIYYNKKLFDEAKIPYPPVDWDDTSWTWAKYVEIAKKLTKNTDDINKAQYGATSAVLNLEGPPMLWGQFIWPEDAYSTGYAEAGVTVSDEKSVAAYQAFHDLVYKDKVAPDPAASQALDQLGGAFASGRLAMAMSGGWGHWAWKELINDPSGFCWGAAPMPMGSPDAKIRTVIYTDPWVITRGLKPDQQDAAWDFVKFLVSPEQAAAYTQATGTPPTQTALLADYYKQFEKCMSVEDMKVVFEGAFTHGRESSNHLMVRWDELNQIWTNNLSTMDNDPNADVKAVLTDIETQTNEALKRIVSEKGQ
jgi:multiple sugar transport system substrate-binding protein